MDSQTANVYVISPDALNLNFMKKRFEKYSCNTKYNLELDNNTYHEFEIRQSEGRDGKENNPDIFIPCYICGLEVPKQFYYEHKNSIIHEINIKIANLVVQRLQKHLKYDQKFEINNNTCSSSSLSKHFCPVCVVSLNSSENTHHYNSAGHKNSIFVEKLLTDFLSVYANEVINGRESLKSDTTVGNSIVEMDREQDKPDIGKYNPQKKEQSSGIKVSVIERKQNITDLESYINILKEKHNSPELQIKVTDENTLEITALDGSVVNVSSDSFHGFKKLGRFTRCIICKDIFNSALKDEHMLTDRHIKLVWNLPLEDKDCIRCVNDSWYHCILCNVGVVDSVTHRSLLEHLNNIKLFLNPTNVLTCDTINSNGKCYENHDNVKSTYIKDNNIIKTSQKNLGIEDKENKIVCEKEKLFCTYCNVFISYKGFKKHCNTTKHSFNIISEYHYLMNVSDTENTNNFHCKVCDVIVKKNADQIKQHVMLPLHLQKYEDLININQIIKINELTLFCTVCNLPLLIKNEIIHIDSKLHTENIEKNKNISKAHNNATTNPVPLSTEQIAIQAGQNAIENVPSPYFRCNICNVNVPNSKENIITHIKGRSHTRKMQALFHPKGDVKNNNIETQKETNDESFEVDTNTESIDKCILSKVNYYLQKTDNISTLNCLVCDVSVTNNKLNISTHCQGKNHKLNYAAIVERNKLVVNDKDVFCGICAVHISIGNEINHCKGKKHNESLNAKS